MKQLYTFILLIITFTIGFSQATGTVDFETNGVGADWTWTMSDVNPTLTVIDNPYKTGNNTSDKVVEFVAKTTDNNWALGHSMDIGSFTFDASNAVVKIMVYKTSTTNFGIKFEGPNPDGTANVIASSEIKVANSTINAWEELTFTFPNTDYGKTFNKIVLIPDFVEPYVNGKDRTADTTVLFDNLQTPLGQTGELFKVSVDMTEYLTENNLTDIGVNIVTNNGGSTWAEAATTEEANNVYSYTFIDLADEVMAEYKWKVYFGSNSEDESLHQKVGGGALENAIATAIPTNEALNTDYSSYGNRTVRSSGTGFTAKTYMFNSTKVSGVTYTELTVDTGTSGQNVVMDWSMNNWASTHGPGTVDNGDGTYTAIVDPTQAFEYKWNNLTTTTEEDLTSCTSSGAAINSGVDQTTNNPFANRVQVAGESKSDTFNTCPANPADAYALYFDFENENNFFAVGDGTHSTAVFEHVTTGGNSGKALKFGGFSDGARGYNYIVQYDTGTFDYGQAASAKVTVDIKLTDKTGYARVDWTTEAPGSGAVSQNDLQGLSADSYTSYTADLNNLSGGQGLFKVFFGLVNSGVTGDGGYAYIDNLAVTLFDSSGNVLGITDLMENSFVVYPNPVQNTLNVSAGVSVDQVSIFDLTGREVMRATPNTSAFSLDVANLNKGLYLVSLKAGDKEMTTKLVK